MLDDNLLEYLIFHGREERNLEYKQSLNWGDLETKVKIVKTAMAMANIPDGGYIVLGVRKNGEVYEVDGMLPEHVNSFHQDEVAQWINEYADPYVELSVNVISREEKQFIVIKMEEFSQLPVVCKKDGQNLTRGDLFTRSRRKIETAKIGSQTEIRELIELAVDKEIRRLHERGFITSPETRNADANDTKLFEQQGGDL